jgi:hypothetical protein
MPGRSVQRPPHEDLCRDPRPVLGGCLGLEVVCLNQVVAAIKAHGTLLRHFAQTCSQKIRLIELQSLLVLVT